MGTFNSVRTAKSAGPPRPQIAPRSDKTQERALYMQSLMTRALAHYEAGRFAEVEPLCLKILAVDVRHADALYVLGVAAFKTGRYELAERMIRRAIAVNDRQPFITPTWATRYRHKGRPVRR